MNLSGAEHLLFYEPREQQSEPLFNDDFYVPGTALGGLRDSNII